MRNLSCGVLRWVSYSKTETSRNKNKVAGPPTVYGDGSYTSQQETFFDFLWIAPLASSSPRTMNLRWLQLSASMKKPLTTSCCFALVPPLDQEPLIFPFPAGGGITCAERAVSLATTRCKWVAMDPVVFAGLGPAWSLSLTIGLLGVCVPVPLRRRWSLASPSHDGRYGPER